MKLNNTKVFKCAECKNEFLVFRFNQFKNMLVDARKYIDCKIVCKRCFYRIKDKKRLESVKSTKNNIPGDEMN